MRKDGEVTRFFSGTLMRQDMKANWTLILVILVIMCMASVVTNYAGSMLAELGGQKGDEMAQEEFFTYLGGLAAFDTMTGEDLSYDDFTVTTDHAAYDKAFDIISGRATVPQATGSSTATQGSPAGTTVDSPSASAEGGPSQNEDLDLSTEGFAVAIEAVEASGASPDTYVREFEYAYALAQSKGVFSGDELDVKGMLDTTLETMGVSSDRLEALGDVDASSMINRVYFTVILPLLMFLLIVVLANSLISEQVDRGSMAYILSTPTRRSAVANTQMIFLIVVSLAMSAIVCLVRTATTKAFYGEVYLPRFLMLFLGFYLLTQAICGICYLGSCLFSQSRKAMAFGGGIAGWCVIASLLGMFGTGSMVEMGIGTEALSVFNNTTVIGLFDIEAISTLGSATVDTGFVPLLIALAAIAVVCYAVGARIFEKKDLPL